MARTLKKRSTVVKKKTTTSRARAQRHVEEGVALGAAVVALGAAAYYFFGPGGKDHQKKAQGWALKMKGDVVHRLEQLKAVDEPLYHDIVDTVAAEYTKTKIATRGEVASITSTMKRAWKSITAPTTVKRSVTKKRS